MTAAGTQRFAPASSHPEGESRPWASTYVTDHAALETLRDLVEQGVLTVRLGEVCPAREAPRAHELLESGVRGRIVLDLTGF